MAMHGVETRGDAGTLVDLLRLRSKETPSRRAYSFLVDGEETEVSINYEELDRRALAIAARLQALGAYGQRVLLLYPSGLEYIAAFFGCLYAGAVAVPVYPPRPNRSLARVESIAVDAGPVAALTATALLADLECRLGRHPSLAALRWLATDSIPDELASQWREPLVTAESLAFLQYTSGSTGAPKGVMLSHANLLHNQRLMQGGFGETEDSIGFGWLPLYHDMGLIGTVLQPLYVGFPCILMAPALFLQRPLRWLKAISRFRVTASGGPNFAYDLCTDEIPPQQRHGLDLSSWQVALNGAEPVRAETMERFAAAFASCGFRRQAFLPCYGLAEATLIVSGGSKRAAPVVKTFRSEGGEQGAFLPASDSDGEARRLVSCGQPLGGQQVVIAHPERFTRLREGEVGEIWVSGPSIARGYWNRPHDTEITFSAYLRDTGEGPFLRTGDLGILDGGELFVTGRLKDLIIIRGANHYPQDIERTVEQSHRALRPGSGAAFSVHVEGEERLVVAYEVRRASLRNLNVEEVAKAIQQAVAAEHELEVYAVLLLKTGAIPKTSSGKIQRRACRAAYLAGQLEVAGQWRPIGSKARRQTSAEEPPRREAVNRAPLAKAAGAIEAWLVARLAERLNMAPEQIDVNQPFVQFGLDSLAAVRLAGALEEDLGRSVSATLVYDYPTIARLARHLADGGEASRPDGAPVRSRGCGGAEPIAIVGLGCRFPGAKDPEAFWELLHNARDAVSEAGKHRCEQSGWSLSQNVVTEESCLRWGGFLDEVDQFDPQFFEISPREAESMDPQQRLLLEVAWEALEYGGLAPERLAGTQTGVFVGISSDDYSRLQGDGLASANGYTGSGNALSIAANRLSYVLDFHGPSWAVDTACSSSLVAVHQACRSLHQRECDLALAGGVNLILSPAVSLSLARAGMISPSGRCKAFDQDAAGYVRGEGCGMVVLKRLSDALRDQDTVLAWLLGSAVNQDGRSNGLTAPNGPSQQAVVRRALADAGVSPADISYVEAHGAGTSLGDPIEVNSLKEVLMEGRIALEACWVGSVKTNIGHLEAAAGIAGLIKVVLALQHGEIPPNLHLSKLNPKIDLNHSSIQIPTKPQPWPGNERRRLAGISSFGFGGTNAHVIVAAPPEPKRLGAREAPERSLHVLPLSAKNETALLEAADRYARWLGEHPEAKLSDVCYTAGAGRSHFHHRAAVVAGSVGEAKSRLEHLARGESATGLMRGRCKGRPRLAWLFTGQDSLYAGMAAQLYRTEPVFQGVLDRCARILSGDLPRPLVEMMFEEEDLLNQPSCAWPALFSFEVALAELWQSWGLAPDVVLGRGAGQYAAACVAGVFSLQDGLRLTARWGQLDEFEALAATVEFQPPQRTLVCDLTGDAVDADAILDAGYWRRHAREAAHFARGVNTLAELGCGVVLELGPHPLLLGRAAQCWPKEKQAPQWIASLRQGMDDTAQLVQAVGRLYTAGVTPDFAAIDRSRPRKMLALPTYPFQRQRYWVETSRPTASADSHESPGPEQQLGSGDAARTSPQVMPPDQQARLEQCLYEIQWRDQPRAGQASPDDVPPAASWLASRVEPTAEPLMQESGIAPEDWGLGEALELLGREYVVCAFGALGWSPAVGECVTTDELMTCLRILPRYRKLVGRMTEALANAGWLIREGLGWRVARAPEFEDPTRRRQELQKRYPRGQVELTLLGRCGRALAEVLAGKTDALDLLFPHEGIGLEALYRDAASMRVFNGLVGRTIQEALVNLSAERRLRVLEIGAGTGGTTDHVLPALPRQRTEYVYTDVSAGFFAAAEERFAAYPFVKYQVLDIERSPAQQGFAEHQYDVVLASNVLHATRDIEETVSHVRQLLAPQGLLVLLELLHRRVWLDITAGLLDGWWRFDDTIRRDHPLLDFQTWSAVLKSHGFELPSLVAPKGVREQGVIVARAAGEPGRPGERAGGWLIFADGQGVGGRLAVRLRERNQTCLLVEQAGQVGRLSEGCCRVPVEDAAAWNQLISQASSRQPLCGIVHLWSLDAADVDVTTPETLQRDTYASCASVLSLLRALLRADCLPPRGLWLVTRGGQPVAGEPCISPAQSPLWGLGKVLAMEHPELACRRIDLDPGDKDPAEHLVDEVLAPDGEDQIGLRHGRRFVPRLSRASLHQPAAFLFRSDCTYLITGGLGGVGSSVARWMVEHGARRLVLNGRRQAGEEARAILAELRKAGADVHVMPGDLSRKEDVRRIFAEIDRSLPPLAGIVHSAGTMDEGMLADQDWKSFAATYPAKVFGAWNLLSEAEAASRRLDFLLFFSSATSVLGSVGAGGYVAANEFLDCLAAVGGSWGLRAMSVDWGPWKGLGLARSDVGKRLRQRAGLSELPPATMLSALPGVLTSRPARLTVVSVDWSTFRQAVGGEVAPFLGEIFATTGHRSPGTTGSQFLALLSRTPADERLPLLVDYLAEEVMRILRLPSLPDPQAGFFELGMDSLMAVELRRRLQSQLGAQVALPLDAMVELPNVQALASHVALQLSQHSLGETPLASAIAAGEAPGGPEKPVPISQKDSAAATRQASAPSATGEPDPRRGNSFPLSSGQAALWFLHHVAPQTAAYNTAAAFRLRTRLDLAAAASAFSKLTERHAILRTTFHDTDLGPIQTVRHHVHGWLDHQQHPDVSDDRMEDLLHEAQRRPFDLEEGPLFRVHLYTRASDVHDLLLVQHHIGTDGRSMVLLMHEWLQLYQAVVTGCPDPLPPICASYEDFVRWQADWLRGEEAGRQLAYWMRTLAGELPMLQLPFARSRPALPSFRGAAVGPLPLGETLSRSLQAIARDNRTTIAELLLAAYAVLLHRTTGQETVLIGVPTLGRADNRFDAVVGHFVNPVTLRSDWAPGKGFAEWLQDISGALREALDHGAYPFDKLVSHLNPDRRAGQSPIFQTVFVFDSQSLLASPSASSWEPLGSCQEGLARVSPILSIGQECGQFDVTVEVLQVQADLLLSFKYRADLFDRGPIERLSRNFVSLLQGMVADARRTVSTLPVLSEEERHQVLTEWNDAVEYPQHKCLHQLFEEQVSRTPDAIAVVFEDQQFRYADLNARSNQLAHRLRTLGVGPEVLVGICAERSLELVVGVLGVLKAGGAYVPLDPQYPADRLALMLRESRAPVLLTQERLLGRLPACRAQVVCLDGDASELTRQSVENPPCDAHPDNLAYVIFTSGSTGRPKGALITHSCVSRLFSATEPWFHFNQRDTWTLFHSFAFDFSVWELWGALLHGGRLIVIPYLVSRSPEEFYRVLAQHRVSVLNQTPSAFHQLMRVDENAPHDRALALRLVILGGEALHVENLSAWWARHGDQEPQLVNMYGITETTVHVTCRPLRQEDLNGQVTSPIGIPIRDLRLYVLDRHLQPAPVGAPGELHVGGAGLARGYLNHPELTAEKFIPNPFHDDPQARMYKTGDLCRWLPDGSLEYLGRLDHQVKIRGFRIELSEIEAALLSHSQVRETIVLAREDRSGQKRLVAYVAPKTGDDGRAVMLRTGALREHLKRTLPDYMIPAAIMTLDALPLTTNGKVDRQALPPPEARPELERQYAAPRNATEEQLCAIWQDLLGVEQVGVHDNFFDLGGDSILCIQVVSRATAQGIRLTARHFFAHQTIAELARAAQEERPILAEQGLATGEAPLTPIQHWFFEQDLVDAHHWNQGVALPLRQHLELDTLQQAVDCLLMHHDALRLRFHRDVSGRWRQEISAGEEGVQVREVDLVAAPAPERAQAIEDEASRLQSSLDLARGPLLRVMLFRRGPDQADLLLILIHHLAVDGVSWRILLEDLDHICQQLQDGKPAHLPAKTTSFRQWSERLHGYGQSEDALAELDHWRGVVDRAAGCPFPVNREQGVNTAGAAATLSVELDRDQTEALLRRVPQAYNTQINDVLLTALMLAYFQWSGECRLAIDLEAHGRAEELLENTDLSRTIGWFTSIYPVVLELEAPHSLGESITSIKIQLRAIPHSGIGYGVLRYLREDPRTDGFRRASDPAVSFNYLGQVGQSQMSGGLFDKSGPLEANIGPAVSPRGSRRHLIDVIGVVTDGALRVHWTYNPARREPSRIEALAALFLQALQQLIHHCDSVAATRPYAKNVSDWQTLKRWYVAEPMDGCSALIGMAAGGVGRNLFLFHPLGGPVNHYRELANELQRIDSRHGIYALQYPALTRRDLWLETVSDMAAHYLSEMRQVQPRGPYHLAGHSGGTIVALEAAQQLRRLKETVGSLILIGIPPISLTMQSRSQRLSRLAWILAPLEASLGAPITFDREALLSLSPGNRARAVLESVAFRAQGVADSEISDLRVIATVALILDQAFAEYTPRPYADSVVMLHEVDDPATRSLERTRGWADYFPDLRVEDIPGDHFSSLRPPHVTRAARAIRQFFTEGADPAPFRNLGAPTQ